jgi:hypothetical protein
LCTFVKGGEGLGIGKKWGVLKEFAGNLPEEEFIQLIIFVAQLRTSSIINYLPSNYSTFIIC